MQTHRIAKAFLPVRPSIRLFVSMPVKRLHCDTRNSSADEIANVNFLRRHRTRTTKYKKREKQTNKQSLNSPQ